MPTPLPSDVHIDAALSKISIAYKNDGYIADKVFPLIPVKKQSDYYFTWDKAHWFRNHVVLRGPGGEFEEAGLTVSKTPYTCVNKGLSFPLPDETIANQDAAIDLERAGADFLAEQFMLDREIGLAAKVMNASAWANSTTLSGTDQWSDYENSDPLEDILTGIQTVQQSIGRKPNIAIMGDQVWGKLRRHPNLLDLYKYTTTAILNTSQVAAAIEVPNIMVGTAVYNSTDEGQSMSGSYIWPKNVLLLYVAPNPGLRTPSAGYTFVWRDGDYTIRISREREATRKRDLLLAEHAYDQKITATDCGYEIINAVA